jgi:hypothetical protein
MSTAAVFFSVEKSFDIAWHPGLLYKLTKWEFLASLIKRISFFRKENSEFR